jgi:flagellar hook-basal body complex protein FliE
MTTLTLEKTLDNELEKQTVEDMNQGSQEPASKADLRNLSVRLESKFDRLDSQMIKSEASLKLYINDKTDRLTTIFISFASAQLAAIAAMFLAIFLRFS